MHSLRRPGRWSRASALLLLPLAGCNYGLTGGGFPEHIRSIHVETFENETTQFELSQQIFNAMVDDVPGALGVQLASRGNADALLTGSILGYDDQAQNYTPGTDGDDIRVLQHQVRISANVRLVDTRENVILWEGRVSGNGQYAPDSQSEDEGRRVAIEMIVREVIDGAQSQW
jgi:hypothetical protein